MMADAPVPRQSNWRFPLWWLLPLMVLLGFAFLGDNGVLRLIKGYQQREGLQVEVLRLKQENEALRADIQALKSDRRYIESIARKELGMVREDELVYQFPSEKNAEGSSLKESAAAEQKP